MMSERKALSIVVGVLEGVREPSEAMLDATGEPGVPDDHYRGLYTAMLDALITQVKGE